MSLTDLIITVFCLIDDMLQEMREDGLQLRQRGPRPQLADSEVLTCEIVGEFLGLDEERQLFRHFRRHYSAFFPKLQSISRTTFTRQAAKLWAVKDALWQRLLRRIDYESDLSIIDSFPVPVCRFARSQRCRRLRAESAYGYDEMARQTYFGLRAHVRIAWPGVIVGFDLAPANVHDLHMARELSQGTEGWLLGDRNYWSPSFFEEAGRTGLVVVAPEKSRKRECRPWPRWLIQMRRRIETVIGQLVGRFQAKRVWARDRWHLTSRYLRKVLSHTVSVFLCQRAGLSPLRFSELITH